VFKILELDFAKKSMEMEFPLKNKEILLAQSQSHTMKTLSPIVNTGDPVTCNVNR